LKSTLVSVACILSVICVTLTLFGQEALQVYTATASTSQGLGGSSGPIAIRIAGFSSDDEKASHVEAFITSDEDGVALLQTMRKVFVNVAGQPGRRIQAVFSYAVGDGTELIFLGEHLASQFEKWRGANMPEFPIAVIHIRLASDGLTVVPELRPPA
jgi:hypothetical protein